MPRNGSGIYSLPPVYLATPGTTIQAQQHNDPFADVAAALTNSLASDGQTPMTGNLQMNARKITGLAAGTNPGDALRRDQVPDLTGLTATVAELNHVDGVTSAIQTQLDGKQPKDNDLTAIAALGSTGIPVRTAADTWAQRQIVSADGSVTITNPAGVAGNFDLSAPGLTISSVVTLTGAPPVNIVTGLTGTPSYAELWFNGASLNSTGHIFVQLGDSGGFVTTGYDSSGASNGSGGTSTAGFVIRIGVAAQAFTGVMIMRRTPATSIWIAAYNGFVEGVASYLSGAGKVTLTGSLTQIRATATAANDFDGSGTVYAAYR